MPSCYAPNRSQAGTNEYLGYVGVQVWAHSFAMKHVYLEVCGAGIFQLARLESLIAT